MQLIKANQLSTKFRIFEDAIDCGSEDIIEVCHDWLYILIDILVVSISHYLINCKKLNMKMITLILMHIALNSVFHSIGCVASCFMKLGALRGNVATRT